MTGQKLVQVSRRVVEETWNDYQPGTRRPYGVMQDHRERRTRQDTPHPDPPHAAPRRGMARGRCRRPLNHR